MVDMPDKDKKCIAYLLMGNNGADLMDELWPHISIEYKESLLKDVLTYEKEQEEDLAADYDLFTVNSRNNSIWS